MTGEGSLQRAVLRPARLSDAKIVQHLIEEALNESPFYNSEMKTHERNRFSLAYICALIKADPRYVLIIQTSKGEDAGLFLSGPEHGTLVNYWSYISKPFRSGSLILRSMARYVEIWNNQSFHKTSAYVRCDNIQPQKILLRVGYKQVARLEKHIFGEDYFLFEYTFNKTDPKYVPVVSYGFIARLKSWGYFLRR